MPYRSLVQPKKPTHQEIEKIISDLRATSNNACEDSQGAFNLASYTNFWVALNSPKPAQTRRLIGALLEKFPSLIALQQSWMASRIYRGALEKAGPNETRVLIRALVENTLAWFEKNPEAAGQAYLDALEKAGPNETHTLIRALIENIPSCFDRDIVRPQASFSVLPVYDRALAKAKPADMRKLIGVVIGNLPLWNVVDRQGSESLYKAAFEKAELDQALALLPYLKYFWRSGDTANIAVTRLFNLAATTGDKKKNNFVAVNDVVVTPAAPVSESTKIFEYRGIIMPEDERPKACIILPGCFKGSPEALRDMADGQSLAWRNANQKHYAAVIEKANQAQAEWIRARRTNPKLQHS